MARSAIQESFIQNEISRALTRANIDHNNEVRKVLEREAEIVGGGRGGAAVSVSGDSLDDRIEQLRHDPSYRNNFPSDPPKVARGDINKLRENFDAIAAGKEIGRASCRER